MKGHLQDHYKNNKPVFYLVISAIVFFLFAAFIKALTFFFSDAKWAWIVVAILLSLFSILHGYVYSLIFKPKLDFQFNISPPDAHKTFSSILVR